MSPCVCFLGCFGLMCSAFDLSCADVWFVLFVLMVCLCVLLFVFVYVVFPCGLCEIGCVMLYGTWGFQRFVMFLCVLC